MKIEETRESVRTEAPDRSVVEVMVKAGTAYTCPDPSDYKEVVVMIRYRLGKTKGLVKLPAGDRGFWSELVRLLSQHNLINKENAGIHSSRSMMYFRCSPVTLCRFT